MVAHIKNKRPNATLSGTVDGEDTTAVGLVSAGSQAALSSPQSGDTNLGSVVLTASQSKNKVFLRGSVRVSLDASLEIREGANVLASATGGGTGTRSAQVNLSDVGIGGHTYTFWINKNVSNYQYGITPGGFPDGNKFIYFGLIFDIDDTHGAVGTKTNGIISN